MKTKNLKMKYIQFMTHTSKCRLVKEIVRLFSDRPLNK